MKEIKRKASVYNKEYDIHINEYLTYSQIQQIIDSTINFDVWAERKQNIDMLIVYHATDIGLETLDSLTHDDIMQSGLLDCVYETVKNIELIYEGLNYTQSIQRSLTQILTLLPDSLKKLEKEFKKYENKK